ncbi:MAG: BatD family protein, partial [Candidatus Auribacterota bacterium]|nr:BatD family protein [Candidatus Auribacterota bacterium]
EPDRSSRETYESAPPVQSRPIFIRTSVDKNEAYVNEQIILSFNLFSRGLRIANLKYSPPPTVGFTEEDLGDQRNYTRIVEGVRYNVIELPKAIFPISPGEVTIGPAELRGDIIVQRRSRRSSFFDEFFSDPFGERKPFVLSSDPIKLTIKPLPREGCPDNFKGAVGDYQFKLTASPLSVKVGEPITVTMTVTGTGNLDTVSIPEIFCGDDFKTYTPEVGIKRGARGGRITGEKIFKQVIIPLSVEAKEIPAVSFSFFDPVVGKYRTIKKNPIPIKVGAAPDQGPVALIEGAGSGPGRERIMLLEKDILYIKDSPGQLTEIGHFYYLQPTFWIIMIGSLLILAVVWRVQNRRDRLRSDLIYARQVGASRSARKRFKQARTFLNAGDSEEFYSEVHRAFNRYLGDKLGIPSGAVGSTVVPEKLSSAGVDVEIIKEVEACFSDFDLARFAHSSSDKNQMKAFLEQVEILIGRLEKTKLK